MDRPRTKGGRVVTTFVDQIIIDSIVSDLLTTGRATIPLPRVGLTLLPPWPQAILYAGKRIENRVPSVAGRVRTWRGIMALTQSKSWNVVAATTQAGALAISGCAKMLPWSIGTPETWSRNNGCVVAAAELLDVQPNGDRPTNRWAVPGQHGLHLGRVAELEPVACTGGRGVFRFGACWQCGRPSAYEKNKALQCRGCRNYTPCDQLAYPELNVRAVYGADGELIVRAA
jgi:hypothetical protein